MEQWEYPEDLEVVERAYEVVPPTSVEEERELAMYAEVRRQHEAIQWLLGRPQFAPIDLSQVNMDKVARMKAAQRDARGRVLMGDPAEDLTPQTVQQVAEGVAEAEAGETVYLGSFAEFLDDYDVLAFERDCNT